MSDFLRSSMNITTFSPANITKVPCFIYAAEKKGLLFFNKVFEGLDVLAVRLRKTDEWFFGIYLGEKYQGYMHFGEIPKAEHEKILEDIMPQNRNDLQHYVDRLIEKIDYHESAPEAWRFIGELDGRKIMQLTKK